MSDSVACVAPQDLTPSAGMPDADIPAEGEGLLDPVSDLGWFTQDLVACLCGYIGEKPSTVWSPSHRQPAVQVRQIAWFVCRNAVRPAVSTPQLGALFRRDHTTVIHGVSRIKHVLKRSLNARIALNATIADLRAAQWNILPYKEEWFGGAISDAFTAHEQTARILRLANEPLTIAQVFQRSTSELRTIQGAMMRLHAVGRIRVAGVLDTGARAYEWCA